LLLSHVLYVSGRHGREGCEGDLPAAPHAKVVGSMAASMVAVGRIHIVASALAGIDAYGMVWYGMYRLLSGA
jgi:hypothetical protein